MPREPRELTKTQLDIVVLVANGMRHEEIAQQTHRAVSSVQKILYNARRVTGARTNAHLVSMVIASGILEWNPNSEEREVNNAHEQ